MANKKTVRNRWERYASGVSCSIWTVACTPISPRTKYTGCPYVIKHRRDNKWYVACSPLDRDAKLEGPYRTLKLAKVALLFLYVDRV